MAKLVIEIEPLPDMTAFEIRQLLCSVSSGEIHNVLCDGEPIDLIHNCELCGSVHVED